MNHLIEGFEEIRKDGQRFVKCGLCGSIEQKSIIPHMKLQHPDEWSNWLKEFKRLRTGGASFKEIMWDFDRLFSWTVIKKELAFNDPLLLNGNDSVKEFFPVNFKLEDSTVWRFANRGKWAVHNHVYPGNWAPEVPRNLILRYSNPGNLILDPSIGGGTSMIECLLLGRNGIGVDINPRAVNVTQLRLDNLKAAAKKQGYTLPHVTIKVQRGDCRNLDFVSDHSVDLVCAHPAYMDVIKYTESCFEDFSRISDPDEYFDNIRKMAREFRRVLKPRGHVGIMIGDVRKKRQLIPLGFRLLRVFEEEGFNLLEIFIKAEERCSTTEFYRNHPSIFRLSHEYVFVFDIK